jgi:transcriptional regulator with XRE-family HTH domain
MEILINIELRNLREEHHMTRGELSLVSGIPEPTIRALERRSTTRPSADVLLKLGNAYNMSLDQVYIRLGLKTSTTHPEIFTDLWERARLASPVAVPVYDKFTVPLGESHEMPVDYVYYSRQKAGNKHLEAFRCAGDCMQPLISDGDTIIVDVETPPSVGDIVLCLVDDGLIIGHYKLVDDGPVIENGHGVHNIDECKRSAVVVGVYKSFK